jgi:hypothetical protein
MACAESFFDMQCMFFISGRDTTIVEIVRATMWVGDHGVVGRRVEERCARIVVRRGISTLFWSTTAGGRFSMGRLADSPDHTGRGSSV